MKQILFVFSSNRHWHPQFARSIQTQATLGSGIVEQAGTSDVVLARCLALTSAWEVLKQSAHDVVLMVDDDQFWAPDQALQIANHVRQTKRAASGCYCMADGRITGHCIRPGCWLTGLGFLAIHRDLFLKVAEESQPFRFENQTVLEFTKSGVHRITDGERHWTSEDFFFTSRLGGVELLPLAIGHLKDRCLVPKQEMIASYISQQETKTHGH